jgi:transketolase
MRFKAYGWNVLHVADVHDLPSLQKAYVVSKEEKQGPTLIILDTHIGYGAPDKQDTSAEHGEALGVEEICLAKRFYGWPENESFLVPEEVIGHFKQGLGAWGKSLSTQWNTLLAAYKKEYPELALQLDRDASHKVQNSVAKKSLG